MNITADGAYTFENVIDTDAIQECIECNTIKHEDILNKENKEDIEVVKAHCKDHLLKYHEHISIKPIWCSLCGNLREYSVKLRDDKEY